VHIERFQIRVKTTQEFDSAVLAYFNQLIQGGSAVEFKAHYEAHVLDEDYDLFEHNCTTICIDALHEAAAMTMQPFAELDHLKPEYDPNSLFHLIRDMEKNWRTRTDPLLSFFNYQR
jgi:transposase-like protein